KMDDRVLCLNASPSGCILSGNSKISTFALWLWLAEFFTILNFSAIFESKDTMWQKITSVSNPHIRELVRLKNKPAERKNRGWMIVEGLRELRMALGYPMKAIELIVCRNICSEEKLKEIEPYFSSVLKTEVGLEVFGRLAYRENSDGFLAIFEADTPRLDSLNLDDDPLVIIIESVEKPGNLGAILRMADAAGCDAIIVSDPRTDIFNPNVIRASLGTVFTVPLAVAESKEVMKWLEQRHITSYAAVIVEDALPYTEMDFTASTAFVLGTEAEGLSPAWLRFCRHKIMIPMRGRADSLNVSIAAAILTFEAVRQRNQPKKA
ncbi:MAG TPA: RNA methyltransferase, partial [Bacteroidales bacterium]|nr:RNA methyltransferase [Bacteroidales bacterium]